MLLLIDNYDSFTYNLYQLLGQFTTAIKVVKNDQITCTQIAALQPEAIILSPGPGNPDDAGVSLEVVRTFAGKIPLFGVCMGMQVICQALGGQIVPAKQLMHGKTSHLQITPGSRLFANCPQAMTVARYHSLAVSAQQLPANLKVTATAADGELMAVEDSAQAIYAVQFHPESVLTDQAAGAQLVANFLARLPQQLAG